jgi:hypothetical protein
MKLRITANLIWDIIAPDYEAGKTAAIAELDSILGDKPIRRGVSITEIISRKQERLGIFRPEEVLPFVTENGNRQEFRVGDKAYQVKMNSHRYHLFAKNLKCVSCDVVGSIMALELAPGADYPHFNLYALDGGSEVLMTKDHIKPIAKGGKDQEKNYQVMCACCNNLKSDSTLSVEAVGELRKIYNANVNRVTAPQLAAIIRDEKAKRIIPDPVD